MPFAPQNQRLSAVIRSTRHQHVFIGSGDMIMSRRPAVSLLADETAIHRPRHVHAR
jgi:hypothetical protein